VANGQVKRVSGERWGPRKRALYLAELAATANHRHAARAAEISYEAVRRRRKKDPRLEAACEAAIAECQRQAPAFLATAMVATFDPEALPDDGGINPLPKVTIGEAIKIAQMDSAKARRGAAANPFEEQAAAMSEEEVDAMRERVLKRLDRLAQRREAEKLAQGWTRDEATNVLIPPGWVRAAE
jgi:hypothetical protein